VIKMLRKMFSLGALIVVAVTFGVGSAAAKPKPGNPGKPGGNAQTQGFSDGRMVSRGDTEGMSDGRI
jgi:hypothetical protein